MDSQINLEIGQYFYVYEMGNLLCKYYQTAESKKWMTKRVLHDTKKFERGSTPFKIDLCKISNPIIEFVDNVYRDDLRTIR